MINAEKFNVIDQEMFGSNMHQFYNEVTVTTPQNLSQ